MDTLVKLSKILRGVKQGYALRCAIFIMCIDPLKYLKHDHNNLFKLTWPVITGISMVIAG